MNHSGEGKMKIGRQGDICEYPACEREVMACRHCNQLLCKIHHDWGLSS